METAGRHLCFWKEQVIQFDPADMDVNDIYAMMTRSIVPRPIAWVSSCSESGVINLAPYSYFNGVCSAPAAIVISPVNWPDGREKDTTRNIRETKEFVVNIVPRELAESMVKTSGNFPPEVNEFQSAQLDPWLSNKVKPPRVAGTPVQFECQLIQIVQVGSGPLAANLIIGEIVLFHVDERIIDSEGLIDMEKLNPVGRLGGRDYCTTNERFEILPS